jgi:SAM-dependent methyltransferase
MKNYIRKIIPKFIKKLIKTLFLMQFKYIFSEWHLMPISKVTTFSRSANMWVYDFAIGAPHSDSVGGWFHCPNHSRGYHGLLRQWWEFHGLGNSVLLVSESIKTRRVFEAAYPIIRFKSCDYFLDIGSVGIETDFIWNMYEDPSEEIINHGKFNAIICSATFEHIMDPVGVLKRLAQLLAKNGFLYMHTHTPLFPYHAFPRDYIRFYPDWFIDVTQFITSLELEELHAQSGHIFACYRKLNN